jgi:dihydroneopterin aldolase
VAADRILVVGLEVFAHHGVQAAEKKQGQRFLVDLDLELDLGQAGRSDQLADTVDYGSLLGEVGRVVAGERWDLIERVAERVAETALSYSLVEAVTVTVHKPEAPIETAFTDLAVRIHRTRR